MGSLFWIGLGILIGVAAAQRKGFSQLGGAIGGALLGPLAFLLFLASDKNKKKCPLCAEWVQAEAKICKHCGHQVEKPNPYAQPGR